MPEIILSNRLFTYHIQRNARRRTIQLKILSPELLEISAPSSIPSLEIDRLLQKKSGWILKKTAQLTTTADNPINATLTAGSPLLYLGRSHVLQFRVIDSPTPDIILGPNTLTIQIPELIANNSLNVAQDLLRKWYVQNASRLFTEKTVFWAGRLAVHPTKLSIRDQKTRWGSCSSRGSIQYNWRIIMAPPEIMDYLVIHELCHIRIPNHSRDFWELVAQFMPEYRQHRAWLKTNASLLTRIL